MKNTVKIIIVVALLSGGVYFLSNNQDAETTTIDKPALSITTSFYPLEFALERIVGEFGTVTNIGDGRDPHDFRPSVQDMVTMQQSDLVVLQGADFESWGDDVTARLEADGVQVAIATANIELHEGGHDHGEEHALEADHTDESHTDEHADDSHDDDHADEHKEDSHDDEHKEDSHDDGHEEDEHEADVHGDESNEASHDDEDEHGAYDPHTWLDPVLFSEMVEHLTEKIVTLDPSNAVVYRENAAALQAELVTLAAEYAARLTNCELDEVITSHDAFGYLADRYNFKVHSIAGLSTQDTPSVTTLAELRAEAAEGIGAILLEENSITAYGETLARETGLQTLSLNPIAYIIPANETYLTLMQSNLDSFAIALACNE
jgi:zinc transport system substrate-binding protein